MIKCGEMTKDEVDAYIRYVERKGKALKLNKDELKKYKAAYDKLECYLRENFAAYMYYMLSGGMNKVNHQTLKITVMRIKQNGLMDEIKKALDDGDADRFVLLCSSLRKQYNETVDCILDMDAALETFITIVANTNGSTHLNRIKEIDFAKFKPVYGMIESVLKEYGIIPPTEERNELNTKMAG